MKRIGELASAFCHENYCEGRRTVGGTKEREQREHCCIGRQKLCKFCDYPIDIWDIQCMTMVRSILTIKGWRIICSFAWMWCGDIAVNYLRSPRLRAWTLSAVNYLLLDPFLPILNENALNQVYEDREHVQKERRYTARK